VDSLRKPFYVVALILMVIVVGVELGSSLLPVRPPSDAELQLVASKTPPQSLSDLRSANRDGAKPGLGIRYLAVLDGLVLLLTILIGTALLLPQSIQGRVASVVTLIVTVFTIIAGIVMIVSAVGLLMLMVGLFLAPPFGTIAYLAIWGFFDRGSASVALSIILLLKLGVAVCLVLAHQGFLKNKGWVVLMLVSLLTTVIVSFLQGLVPVMLVSITDAVAALVVGSIGVLWALFMLIGSIIGIVKGLRFRAN
jgi:hypothetical protein